MYPDKSTVPFYKAVSKKWIFTAYDLDEQATKWAHFLRDSFHSGLITDYFWGTEECPTTGTRHMHIGLQFPENKRYTAVKRLLIDHGLHAWLENMKGDWLQAKKYAFKDQETASEVGWPVKRFECQEKSKFRTTVPQSAGSRKRAAPMLSNESAQLILSGQVLQAIENLSALEAIRAQKYVKEAMEIVPQRALEPVIVWVYGPTQTGKTTFAEWSANKSQVPVHWQGLEENAKFWNGYVGQEVVVLDEARERNLPFQTFLRLATRAPFQVELKNSYRPMDSPLIFVTAPCPPWHFWTGTVNQRGHVMDIEQVMGRITIVMELLPRESVDDLLVVPLRFLDGNLIPGQAPTMISSHTEDTVESAKARFKKNVDAASEGQSDLPGFLTSLSTNVAPAQMVEEGRMWKALPVVTRTITMTASSCVTQSLEAENDENVQIPWAKKVRLPQRLSAQDRMHVLKSLAEDKSYDLKFVVHSRRIKSEAQEVLLRHYYGNFFDAEHSYD